MPYGLRKLPDKDLYKVFNKDTGEVHSKATTKGNALKQIRLLYMLERKKETEGGEISYPKLEDSLQQDRSDISGEGCCAKCDAMEGRGKSKKTLEKELKEIDDDLDRIEKENKKTKLTDEELAERTKERLNALIELGKEKGGIPYNSNVVLGTILFMHLLEKYGNKCLIAERSGKFDFLIYGFFIYDDKDNTEEVIDSVSNKIKKCFDDGVDTIVVPITLWCSKAVKSNEGVISTHANLLIFRKFGYVEHFEPHGKEYRGGDCPAKDFYARIKTFVEKVSSKIGKLLVYAEPQISCPNIRGFQSLENKVRKITDEGGGFCLMWSLLATEMVLLNPKMLLHKIYDLMFDIVSKDPDRVLDLIRGYVVEAQDTINQLFKRLKNAEFRFRTIAELEELKQKAKVVGYYSPTYIIRSNVELRKALEDWALDSMFEARVQETINKKKPIDTTELQSKRAKLAEKIATRGEQGRKKGSKNKATILREENRLKKFRPELQETYELTKPLASKTFVPPYQPTGNYMTPWRWVLYKERELQNSTYAKMMKDPSVKALYYKLKEKADEDFNVDWLEANYMKNRRGIKGEPKPKETKQEKLEKSLKGTKKITDFF